MIRRAAALLVIAIGLFIQPLAAQGDLGQRQVRGPAVLILDSAGIYRVADLGPGIVLDPPATSGGRYILRAITPVQPPAPQIRQRSITVVYSGMPVVLPSTPLANTFVFCLWGALFQEPTEYTVTGASVRMAAGFLAGDKLTFVWFE